LQGQNPSAECIALIDSTMTRASLLCSIAIPDFGISAHLVYSFQTAINSGDIAFSRLLNNNSSMIAGCFRRWDNRAEQLLHFRLQNSITVARLSYTYECEQRRKGQSAS